MSHTAKLAAATAVFCLLSGAAMASDAADIARTSKLPQPVVESVLTNVDAYFTSPSAPSNQMMSGIVKGLALKAIKSQMGNLDEATPGKTSDASDEEKSATYRAAVRISQRNTSESSDCVENKVTLTSSEGIPLVKDGAFTFDMVHPRVTNWDWKLTFCRTAGSNGDYSDWQPAAAK
jgi:hypothetical protein